ncbi:serine protease [Sporosarcina sp. P17b]|uniref:S1 family peptidase n=1 Tax=Sporosarcina sp. P17b TaxID=2048260 RepID=UPI001E336453|nr:serine protease [Sporosarcina sp. P17b]
MTNSLKEKEMENLVYSIGRLESEIYYPLGTCTLINKIDTLITAAHVVNGNDNNLVIKINNNISGYQDTTEKKLTLVGVKIEMIDPIKDICVLKLVQASGAKSNLRIGNTDSLAIGEKVAIIGFPHSDLGRIVLTQQTTEVGAKILLGNSGVKTKHLVLNIQARPGQSGSPVISLKDRTLVGILIGPYVPTVTGGISLGGIDPQTLHQTTHVVSSEYLQRMIENEME